jgi:hypothetical protein
LARSAFAQDIAGTYCQRWIIHVALKNASSQPEERNHLHLLYALYACVFWRGEASPLSSLSLKVFKPTARRRAGGFFVLPNEETNRKTKEFLLPRVS